MHLIARRDHGKFLLKPAGSEHIDRIREAAAGIMAGLARGEDVGGRIASLNAMTGHEEYDVHYFESLPGHSSIDEFAGEAALPVPRGPSLVITSLPKRCRFHVFRGKLE
jgi:hypothetical protein